MSSASRRSSQASNISRGSKPATAAASKVSADLVLSSQSLECGLSKSLIPFATLSIIALCVFIYTQMYDMKLFYVKNACLGLYQVFYYEEWLRLFTCHVVHNNPWELGVNLLSFLWKGVNIECKCGPLYLFLMLVVMSPCCSFVILGVQKMLADSVDPVYVTECFCGLSSLNFALKVIKAYNSANSLQCVIGTSICLKVKYLIWIEFLISYLVSTTSTIAGNVAGVVVGTLFILGPLQWIIELLMAILTGGFSFGGFTLNILNGTPSRGFGSVIGNQVASRKASASSQQAKAATSQGSVASEE